MQAVKSFDENSSTFLMLRVIVAVPTLAASPSSTALKIKHITNVNNKKV